MATYYLDFTATTGLLTGTCTFTAASGTLSGSGTSFVAELAVGDYVRVSDGTQWYKVTGVTDDTTATISPTFKQSNVTDSVDSTRINSNDGSSTSLAFAHFNQYCTDNVRTAGDILKVRANQTHVSNGVDVSSDEDGTADALIEIRGCSVADDPWSDSSDVIPILSFGDASYQFKLDKDFWRVYRLDVTESTDSGGAFSCDPSMGSVIEQVNSYNNDASPACKGMYINHCDNLLIKDCNLYSNRSYNMTVIDSVVKLDGVVFNGGGGTYNSDWGIYANYPSVVIMKDCTFGVTTTHDSGDLYLGHSCHLYGQNVTLSSATKVSLTDYGSFVRIDDYDGVKGDTRSFYYHGNVTKDTGVTHSGGASSSAKMEPNSNCGLYLPLVISGSQTLPESDFVLWCPASETTITVYIRSFGVWSSYPTASELYITAEYWDGATAERIESTHSAQVLSDETTWVAFTTTFTPNAAGWVYVRVYLKKYEASKGCYVDIKPVVS